MFYAQIYAVVRNRQAGRAGELIDQLGLGVFAGYPLAQPFRRLAPSVWRWLARCAPAPMLFLDEPTAGGDPSRAANFGTLFTKWPARASVFWQPRITWMRLNSATMIGMMYDGR
jgi:hypothetical protein